MQARCVQRALAVAHEAEHDLARIRKGPPGRLGRKAALMIFHGSKHPVSGASARRPILVYKAATYEGELLRITLPRTPVNMRACVNLRRPHRAASATKRAGRGSPQGLGQNSLHSPSAKRTSTAMYSSLPKRATTLPIRPRRSSTLWCSMTLTRIPRCACSDVMLWALLLLILVLFPAIKLERRSRVCTPRHLVPERTALAARGV